MTQARRLVQHVIAYIRQEATMTFDVSVRTIATQPIVSITKRVNVDQLIPHFWRVSKRCMPRWRDPRRDRDRCALRHLSRLGQ